MIVNITNVVLQVAIYFLAVFGTLLAVYTLALDPRDMANRYLSAMLAVFAIIDFGAASFLGAGNAAEAAWPSYILATGVAAVNPLILLTAVTLIKPTWLTGRKRWLAWFIYVAAVLPFVLTVIDVLTGTKLWYTGLDTATYQGGLPSRKEYFDGILYSFVAPISLFIPSFMITIFLVYASFLDKTLSKQTKRIAWTLLTVQFLASGLFFIVSVSPAIRVVLSTTLFHISYSFLALGRLISSRTFERALRKISIQRRLQVVFWPGLLAILFVGVGMGVIGNHIQGMLRQLLQIDANTVDFQAIMTTVIENARATQARAMSVVVGGIFLATAIGGFVFYVLSRQIMESIKSLQHAAEQLGAGNLSIRAEVQGNDEIAATAHALNLMAERLQGLFSSLEEQARDRTQSLETSAEISRQLTVLVELDELLQYAVNQICDGFSLYYTHIYLTDDKTGDLVMMAGSGEVGKLLKAKGHRLKPGEGIVGAVASLDEYFMSNNVHEAINWVPNVLLPDTQSELAVPLRKGDQVLGVLDLQSDKLNRFSNEDVITLQSLANQIAAAVDNARLLAETQAALQEVERLNRRLTHESWLEFEQDLGTSGYRFIKEDVAVVQPASDLWLPQMRQAAVARQIVKQLQPGNGDPAKSELAVPLILRGEVIGALGIRREGEADWTSEEEAIVSTVADQVARALESARLTEEQAKTIGQLKEVDRLKTGFLTSMSHELRTPLNSIIGFADILLQGIDGPLEENAITDIKAIHGSGKHLLALINDILDLSKIEAGRMELVYSAVSVPIVFKEVAASVASLLKDRPIRLVQKVNYELPKIWADPLRFSQIVINLVSNAVKFTEEGTITMAAEVFNEREMHIYVQDTGIGIPDDKLDLIFESFRQADARNNRKYQGTGMGLAISKQLVEIHGGYMWVESVLGKGTTFHFTIGLAPEGEQVSG